MKWVAFVLALTACGGHHEAADYPRDEHDNCDPKGADVARWVEPSLDDTLFPDEIALRGKCTEEALVRDYTRNPNELAAALQSQASDGHRSCDGVCEPFRAALSKLDDHHDLDDDTFQRECTLAVTKLDEKIRGGCRHVCLAERRLQGARMLFARVMRGLYAFEGKVAKIARSDADVRRMWSEQGVALPPKRVRLATTTSAEMTAEGTLYPGGPALRLRLALMNAGCDQMEWSVERW
jgi:hypothetical protein